jgi:hypothetical protein
LLLAHRTDLLDRKRQQQRSDDESQRDDRGTEERVNVRYRG